MTTLRQAAEELAEWFSRYQGRFPHTQAVADKLASLCVAEPLTRERAREIVSELCGAVVGAIHDRTLGKPTPDYDAVMADRLIALLGPQPKRKVTRAEVIDAQVSAMEVYRFAVKTGKTLSECAAVAAAELARRLGLEVGQ